MAILFHDRQKGIIHQLTTPIQDWPLAQPENRREETLTKHLNEAAAQSVQLILRRNKDLLFDGRSNIGPVPGRTSQVINNTADGQILRQDFPSGGRNVFTGSSTRLSYGFSESDLKTKADQLERNAQAKGK